MAPGRGSFPCRSREIRYNSEFNSMKQITLSKHLLFEAVVIGALIGSQVGQR
jgi:hypothetical protein